MKNQRGNMVSSEALSRLKKRIPEDAILLEEPMKKHTSFRIGGPAEAFCQPEREEDLAEIMKWIREEKLPYFLLGNGSNLLVGDLGIPGVVVSMGRLKGSRVENEDLYVMAGTSMAAAYHAALDACLSGLEFASGIPGSVGGGVFMDAGAYGGEIRDVLTSVRVLLPDGSFEEIPAEKLNLSYRHSAFMEDPKGQERIVVGAHFHLNSKDPEEIAAVSADFNQRRREKQPLEYGSAGSTFKRPEGYFAGKLIQDAGLQGYRVGDAEVSKKHAGFVINLANASAADVLAVIRHVQETVWEKFGVKLEPEVRLVGSFMEEDSRSIPRNGIEI
ncbi:MAG: UDP-N-acetylmuramate dehydrogenase [Lachnospiraceae bacterium]|nr:UDP-N-acetylmuramate dehydrogenase [Lachnospiraceae bacterium]